jgi:hypothetical protein
VPSEISASVKELEALRGVRNSVGHEFGRQTNHSRAHGISAAGTRVRVSEKRLVKWLALVETIAKKIDAQLHGKFVGEFENILFYHKWRANPRKGHEASLSEARALKKAMGTAFGPRHLKSSAKA